MRTTRTNTAKWLPAYNRWQINVQKDGIRKTFSSSKPGRSGQIECNTKADNWLISNVMSSKTTVNQLFEMYMKEKELSVTHARAYALKCYYRKHISKLIGSKKVSRLKLHDLQAVINEMYYRDYTKSTIKQMRILLGNLLKYARKNELTTLTTEFVEIPKNARDGIPKKALQLDEVKTVLTVDETLYNRRVMKDDYINAYRFILLTGLRRGECLALHWSDLIRDIDGNTILKVERSYNTVREMTKGKNNNAQRDIILNELAVQTLQEQKKLLISKGIDPDKNRIIFPNVETGSYLNPNCFKLYFQKYARHNNLSISTVHELRHTYITINKDLDIRILKKLVGHSESLDTLGIYSHELHGEKEKAVKEVERKFRDILRA